MPVASSPSLRGLDWLNFFLADVQSGVGPFLAIYLAATGWNEQSVGIALSVGGMAGILAQTPAGALVDRLRPKRALIATGVLVLAAAALLIAAQPSFWPVISGQILIGASSSVFIPAVCAISLGLVGSRSFDRRHELARGAAPRESREPAQIMDVMKDRPLAVFLVCAVMFHFANAAMLPLLGEMLAKGHGRTSMMFMSACVVTTQLIVTLLASWSGRLATRWGRKPLLLIAFSMLPVRGVLYTMTKAPGLLIAIQMLDGVAAAIFGVVSVLVIADLTRGSGRFNLTLGAVTAAVGIGAALSQAVAGTIVHRFGYHTAFLFLATVAAAALGVLHRWMPETQHAS